MSDCTPVAHCKIAGEGIEFDWGFSKLAYRAKPISLKRNKTKFHSLVDSVLSDKVLTISVCRANARRARSYMLAYLTLMTDEIDQNSTTQHGSNNQNTITNTTNSTVEKQEQRQITHLLIERCVGLFRKRQTHRNVQDFDTKYIKDEFEKNVLQGMTVLPKMEQPS